MNNTKKQPIKQDQERQQHQEHQQQKARREQELEKQGHNPGRPHENLGFHEQELPETRMTR